MGKEVRVVLNDGTEHYGRLFMILNSTKHKVNSVRSRKVICLEIENSQSIVRINEADIKEVFSDYRKN